MKTRSCSESTLSVDQALPAPVCGLEALAQGMGSQVQRSLPVRASNARTMPRPTSTFQLSAMEEPVMTRSLAMAAAELTGYPPRHSGVVDPSAARSQLPALGQSVVGLRVAP